MIGVVLVVLGWVGCAPLLQFESLVELRPIGLERAHLMSPRRCFHIQAILFRASCLLYAYILVQRCPHAFHHTKARVILQPLYAQFLVQRRPHVLLHTKPHVLPVSMLRSPMPHPFCQQQQ